MESFTYLHSAPKIRQLGPLAKSPDFNAETICRGNAVGFGHWSQKFVPNSRRVCSLLFSFLVFQVVMVATINNQAKEIKVPKRLKESRFKGVELVTRGGAKPKPSLNAPLKCTSKD